MAKDRFDRVAISHPDSGGSTLVPREAFEKVWKPKGWVETTAALEQRSKAELEELAVSKGVDVAAGATKSEIAQAIVDKEA